MGKPITPIMPIMPIMERRDKHVFDTRVVRSLQRYDFEDPYEVTKQVEVAAGAAGNEVTVDFELTLRGD